MYKLALSLSVVLCAGLLPIISFADDHVQPKKINSNESLQNTEQRLNALIKAAAQQNLVDIQKQTQGGISVSSQSYKPSADGKQSMGRDCILDVFSFPSNAHISTYEDLQSLKNQAVNGRGEIDLEKSKILALSYLGLGFGEEAKLISTTLEQPDKYAVQAMANILMGNATAQDIGFIQSQISCGKEAQIWHEVTRETLVPYTDIQVDNLQGSLAALPGRLKNILGSRVGLKSLQAGDIKTATKLYKKLKKQALKNPETHAALSPDLHFLGAMLAANSDDAAEKKKAMRSLKGFAKYDNPYRVQALQMVTAQHFVDSGGNQEGDIYPGFAQDLDAAVQTYAQHKMGKQALAQKVVYLAQTHALNSAVNLAKSSFEAGDVYFKDSVIAISGFVHKDLNSDNANTKILALQILLREASFFADLNDIDKLKSAGVAVCAQLAMPKLAAQIMPMDTWYNLDENTQTLLALSFGHDLRQQNIARIFSKHILQKAEFKALEIGQAFSDKNPARAIEVLSNTPNNNIMKNAFVANSWTAGYWSLVDSTIRTQTVKDKTASEVSLNAQHKLAPEAKKLAENLSANAPLLAMENGEYDIAELTSLQTYLNNDLAVFKAYLQLDSSEDYTGSIRNNQGSGQDKNNG